MKKILFLLILASLSFTYPSWAQEKQCTYGNYIRFSFNNIYNERQTFKYEGYYIFINYYQFYKTGSEAEIYVRGIYKEFIRLAKEKWTQGINLDVDDYWDKDGNTTPFILIEVGGAVLGDRFYNIGDVIKIGTCFDRQSNNFRDIYSFNYGPYEKVIRLVEEGFIPLISLQRKGFKR